MQILINKTRYTLQFLPPSKMPGAFGLCDHPNKKNPRIRIRSTLQGIEKLDTIIHELLHAACWCLGEESICKGATHVSSVLELLGVVEGGEWDSDIREAVYHLLRMIHLQCDSDAWAERTADEIAVVLKNLGYGV